MKIQNAVNMWTENPAIMFAIILGAGQVGKLTLYERGQKSKSIFECCRLGLSVCFLAVNIYCHFYRAKKVQENRLKAGIAMQDMPNAGQFVKHHS